MEDLEYTQGFDDYAQPGAVPPDSGHFPLILKVTNMLQKEGTSQIIIHLIHLMLTLHNIKSKT